MKMLQPKDEQVSWTEHFIVIDTFSALFIFLHIHTDWIVPYTFGPCCRDNNSIREWLRPVGDFILFGGCCCRYFTDTSTDRRGADYSFIYIKRNSWTENGKNEEGCFKNIFQFFIFSHTFISHTMMLRSPTSNAWRVLLALLCLALPSHDAEYSWKWKWRREREGKE